MDKEEKIKLWSFSEIKPLSNHSVLVENEFNGVIMVKKFLSDDAIPVYEKAKSLNCKNIARVYDVGMCEGNFCALCEYVSGITISNLVECRTIDNSTFYKIMLSLFDALECLHALNIVHRDIKPQNIVLSNDGVVKLIDLGISRVVKNEKSQDTNILGTVGFAAPEQFGFGQSDSRTDIYSLGVLMNYLLEKTMPCEKLHNGMYRNIILKCTNQNPDMRYFNIAQLRSDFLNANGIFYNSTENNKLSVKSVAENTENIEKSKIEKFIFSIPLIKEGKPSSVISSLLFHATVLFFIYGFSEYYVDNFIGILGNICFLVFGIFVPYFVGFDIGGVFSKSPLIKNISPRNKKIVKRFIVSFCYIIVFAVLIFVPSSYVNL